VNLSKEDLQVATDLWDKVINPACLDFQKRTGKPAEAMREAIARVIARRVNHHSSWNAFQKVWWNKQPTVHDKELQSECLTSHDFPLDQICLQRNSAHNASTCINPQSMDLRLKNPGILGCDNWRMS
jgi:hypothetical protein